LTGSKNSSQQKQKQQQAAAGPVQQTITTPVQQTATTASPDPLQAIRPLAASYERIITQPVTILYKREKAPSTLATAWGNKYTGGPKNGTSMVEWTKKRFLGSRLKGDDLKIRKADVKQLVKDGADTINTSHAATIDVQLPYVVVDGDTREEVLNKDFNTDQVRDAGRVGTFWYAGGRWMPASDSRVFPFEPSEPPPWTELYYTSQRGYSNFEVLEGENVVKASAVVPTQDWIDAQRKAVQIEEDFDKFIKSLKEKGGVQLRADKMVDWHGASCNAKKGTAMWSWLYGDKVPGRRQVYRANFRWDKEWQFDGGEVELVLGWPKTEWKPTFSRGEWGKFFIPENP